MLDSLWYAASSFVILVVVFTPLEKLFPARAQAWFRREWLIDASFFLGQYLVFSAISYAVLGWVFAWLWPVIPGGALATVAVLPLWLQGLVALLLGDFFVYWFHRTCHQFSFLWRFHAVHHSSEQLDWLAAHREHPFDGICTQLFQNLPLVFFGFPPEILAGLAVFRGAWGIFIHSNVSLSVGPLRYVLGAPALHHWHHARGRTAHNFANLAPWLDVLFGTYHLPRGPETYPLGLDEPWPRGYAAQLVRPFLPSPRPKS
jgi:sterol desaturase/sphingolipid hydroxylase (fatty acid hydroxylase superfamily)